jgi:hypothetical protein
MPLKWLRNGVEDYEYVLMLKQSGRGEWAMDVSRQVVTRWTAWTKTRKPWNQLACNCGEYSKSRQLALVH